MRKLILILALLATPAAAQTFTDTYGRNVTCTGSGPVTCTSGDGLTVGAASAAQAQGVFNGMAPSTWTPPLPPVTTIPAAQLLARLTPAEALGIQTAALTNAQVALWLTTLQLNGVADNTNPQFQAGLAAFVAAGLLTQARATQVADFSVKSP